MKQTDLGLHLSSKRTFLDEMERVVPWSELVALIEPHYPKAKGKTGRPPFAIAVMLRIHFLQQWFGLSDPAMEEALHDTPMYRGFAGIEPGPVRLPDESTTLRFRHLLEAHGLALGMLQAINDTLRERRLDAQDRHRGRRHADCRAELDQERLGRARLRDAPDQEGQAVVLRHEGPHRCGRRVVLSQ